jgi:fatty-acyl-CoA synthase
MRGLMMDYQLTTPAMLRRTDSLFSHKTIVTRKFDQTVHRYTYGECLRRARKLAVALQRAGVRLGDRVATLCWNHFQHLEAYFGIPMAGAVVHTLNLRLHPGDLAYIVNHAEDRVVIIDTVLWPVFESFRDRISPELVIAVSDDGRVPEGTIDFEKFLSGGDPDDYRDPVTDEYMAAAMCYTSGTTGKPKGVLYSHRALLLHSMTFAMSFDFSEKDVVLPIVPMFHANCWGIPFSCALVGAGQVLPGPWLDAPSVADLFQSEGVTFTAGVPTIWASFLQLLDSNPGRYDLSKIRAIVSGGSAVPLAMIRAFEERHNLKVIQPWGMTETGPLGTVADLPSTFANAPAEERYAIRAKQGWPAPFVELRARAEDGLVSWDGRTMGELEIRSPWVASSYYKDPSPAERFTPDGWLRTGDIVTIDPSGCIQIQDRSKDLIKSGGEWISSVALESALLGHPAVAEAAVIAIPHSHWQERPLAVVVLKPGARVSAQHLRDFLEPHFAKWWIPDAFEFVEAIPRTATGKILKYALREQFKEYNTRNATGDHAG